jgi:hypothetical protein
VHQPIEVQRRGVLVRVKHGRPAETSEPTDTHRDRGAEQHPEPGCLTPIDGLTQSRRNPTWADLRIDAQEVAPRAAPNGPSKGAINRSRPRRGQQRYTTGSAGCNSVPSTSGCSAAGRDEVARYVTAQPINVVRRRFASFGWVSTRSRPTAKGDTLCRYAAAGSWQAGRICSTGQQRRRGCCDGLGVEHGRG